MYAVVATWFAAVSARVGDVYIAVVNTLGAVIGK
jgi:hypothetical protein